MSTHTDATPRSTASAGSAFVVAVVLLRPGRRGVTKMILRQGIWWAAQQETAIEMATSEARTELPGWTVQMAGATAIPPNSGLNDPA